MKKERIGYEFLFPTCFLLMIFYGLDNLDVIKYQHHAQNEAELQVTDHFRFRISRYHFKYPEDATHLRVSENNDGDLECLVLDDPTDRLESYHRITTPKEGNMRLRLPDGELIYMDGECSLKFPTNFNRDSVRIIVEKGNVHFDVPDSPHAVFLVRSEKVQVQTKGSHLLFAVSAEDSTVTAAVAKGRAYVTYINQEKKLSAQILYAHERAEIIHGVLRAAAWLDFTDYDCAMVKVLLS